MDRILRRELDAIARDIKSGAAELALQATDAVQAWLRRQSGPDTKTLLSVARHLCLCKPSMVPFLRLANEIACFVETKQPAAGLSMALRRFRATTDIGPKHVALRFKIALAKRKEPARVITYSYSSTVLRSLIAARKHVRVVLCSESRPGNEGRKTVQRLATAGIRVELTTDADPFSHVLDSDLVIVGADAVLRDAFINKIGTECLFLKANDMGASFWVATDTSKFWPEMFISHLIWKGKSLKHMSRAQLRSRSLWPQAPKGIYASYSEGTLFGATNLESSIRFLTERGWMTPRQVRKELGKIRISPRLKELVD